MPAKHPNECRCVYCWDLSKEWTVQLSRYQRDNLYHLLTWIINGSVGELHHFNTGDWLGEIVHLLSHPDGEDRTEDQDHPNFSLEGIKDIISRHNKKKCQCSEKNNA